MVAGTSTGGVIAAALSVPSNEYKNESYPVSEILDVFKQQAPIIFEQQTINSGLMFILTLLSCLMGGGYCYVLGRRKWADPNVKKTIKKGRKFLKQLKEAKKEDKKDPQPIKRMHTLLQLQRASRPLMTEESDKVSPLQSPLLGGHRLNKSYTGAS